MSVAGVTDEILTCCIATPAAMNSVFRLWYMQAPPGCHPGRLPVLPSLLLWHLTGFGISTGVRSSLPLSVPGVDVPVCPVWTSRCGRPAVPHSPAWGIISPHHSVSCTDTACKRTPEEQCSLDQELRLWSSFLIPECTIHVQMCKPLKLSFLIQKVGRVVVSNCRAILNIK